MKKTRVLVIDDSALVRRLLREIFEADGTIDVVGQAPDPLIARELIKQLNPDVLTLDVEMPHMDGLTFLANLMRLRPMPVVMVSSLTERGAQVTLEALELGAFDFVPKPKADLQSGLDEVAGEIVAKVKAAAAAAGRIRPRPAATAPANALTPVNAASASGLAAPVRLAGAFPFRTTERLIAIGASTGGTEAIREVLEAFPPDAPATVITQHIPPGFSRLFAERLDRSAAVRVLQAEHGARLLPGHAYVAPGGHHLRVERSGAFWISRLTLNPPLNLHRPSVDYLFESVAAVCGVNATGVLLTGMGTDGAQGLKLMREAGACTIAQDEATSIVWGMPGSAVRLGAAALVLPLPRIAEAALRPALRAA